MVDRLIRMSIRVTQRSEEVLMTMIRLLVAWGVMRLSFTSPFLNLLRFSKKRGVNQGGFFRTSTYTTGSSVLNGIVEENGRTYHVYKDGSEFKFDYLSKKSRVPVLIVLVIEYMLPNDEVILLFSDEQVKNY